jgi:hypothetical protein
VERDEERRLEEPIHGRGWSSPVVPDPRSGSPPPRDDRELSVIAIDRDSGKVLTASLSSVDRPGDAARYSGASRRGDRGGPRLHPFRQHGTAALDTQSGKTSLMRRPALQPLAQPRLSLML